MQISSTFNPSQSMGLQALRDLFQPSSRTSPGQALPGDGSSSAQVGRAFPPKPQGLGAVGFSPDTMSSLFAAQEAGQSPAASLLSVADGDGDGALTLDELSSALGVEGDDLSAGFTDIDANADGQVDASELDAGLRGMFERNGPPRGMMGADVASSLLSIADSDEGGSLSLSELLSALGETEEDGEVSSNFADYDTDGDQALNADELSAAFEAMISRMLSAYQSGTTDGDAALSVAV